MFVAAKAIGLKAVVLQDLPLFPGSCTAYNSELELITARNYSGFEDVEHFTWLYRVFQDVAEKTVVNGRAIPSQPHLKKDEPWTSLY